ncbi:urease accessory protein UreH domain-containing protein [Aliterella atlantica]|uniref:Ferric reductase n=1 Tax=Aliterella atlantica CENA595 TaxID=1618023 RepID=A0A0D8ZW56_9CYAN|nr:sulfite exporter TauE/SafE family protein [Aliterella atlantica]KJH72980.1 ferric reductase [Aliterella atlantica CENA595]
MLHLELILAVGFFGSFGHCMGMCGPLAAAFSLSQKQDAIPKMRSQILFHLLLNAGRLLSYALVGAGIGAVSSVAIASGQLAGSQSDFRQAISIFTSILLIWFGISQIDAKFLPPIPFLHPLISGTWHTRLSTAMTKLSLHNHWWTPACLGIVWGLMPCGFLYTAQIKAAGTGSVWQGTATMLAFGIGTLPMMLGLGVSTSFISKDRRSQLYRLAGWVTIIVGVLTLFRSMGEEMLVYATGHGAILCLMLALVARPLRGLWAQLLKYRRTLGVGSFVLAIAHVSITMQHNYGWDLESILFLIPKYQYAIGAGAIAFLLLLPAALTSSDRIQRYLGKRWRTIHLLSIPALLLATIHIILIGPHYLGTIEATWLNQLMVTVLGLATLGILILRWQNPPQAARQKS